MHNASLLSPEMQEFFPRFMQRKWMDSYGTLQGIENVLQGMSRHTSLPDKTADGIAILKQYYDNFRDEFFEFFPLLMEHIETNFQIPLRDNMPGKILF